MGLQCLPILTVLAIFLNNCVNTVHGEAEGLKSQNHRQGQQFSIFQVIRFTNGPCNGIGSGQGTCYTSQECSNRKGVKIGSCASGFGVCCRITISCGETSSENGTIFSDSNIPTGMGDCTARICPTHGDICQLRLDFQEFQIAGPSTDPSTVIKLANGNPSDQAMAIENAILGQCLVDRFQVSSGSRVTPPIICGINTNQHVFVDADSECNSLSFQLGHSSVARTFQIRVTQYECNSPNLAPTGCTQYFTSDSGSGTVQSFNFGNGHLANQNQVMCVRRNQNACRICWTTQMNTDFDVSGTTFSGAGSLNLGSFCCGSNTRDSLNTLMDGNLQGYDCVSLPFAENKAGTKGLRQRFCGRNAGLTSGSNGVPLTVCSRASPFRVAFRSNAFEVSDPNIGLSEAANRDKGVKLIYFQDSFMCF